MDEKGRLSTDVSEPGTLEQVSVEHDGVVLSGVGVSEESLRETLESRAPVEPEPATNPPSSAETEAARARDEGGRFAKPSRGQRRFDQLTKERETERSAREAAEQRAADLEKRLAALEQARQPVTGMATSPSAAPEPRQPEPEPAPSAPRKLAEFTNEIGTKYQTYEDALEAYHEYRAQDFDARIRTRIEADRASRDFQSHVSNIFDQGRKSHPDFDTVVGASKVIFPNETRHRIVTAANAPDLMYALGKDDALAQKIAAIRDPFELGMALSQVVTPVAVASPASTAPVVSQAPVPYQPVGSSSKTAGPTLTDYATSDEYDYDKSGWREKRNTDRRAGRR